MSDERTHVAFARLVRALDAGQQVRPCEVAERYEVSQRTAQRWLSDIDLYLFPLDALPPDDPGAHYRTRAYRKARL